MGAEHLQRGDCGREDADHNYTVIDGPGPKDNEMPADKESESVFGGIIEISKKE